MSLQLPKQQTFWLMMSILLSCLGILDRQTFADDSNSQPTASTNPDTALREAFLISVPLPITGQVDQRIKGMIDQVIDRLPVAASSQTRPVLVLEFATQNGASGKGSEFERCMALARYLTSEKLNRVQTVAFVPGAASELHGQPAELAGHALLVALACESIVLHESASLGDPLSGESALDPFIAEGYRVITEQKRSLPLPLVQGMLSKGSVYRIKLNDDTFSFGSEEDLKKLESEGKVIDSESILTAGSTPALSAEQLLRNQLISARVATRREVAVRLRFRADALEGDPSLLGDWKARRLLLNGPLNRKQLSWAAQAIAKDVESGTNLFILEIDSSGGAYGDAASLAEEIAKLDPTKVRTVAVVHGQARSSAALLALSADHLVMFESSSLGGVVDDQRRDAPSREDIEDASRRIAQLKGRDWSFIQSLQDSGIIVARYRNADTGEIRILSERDWNEFPDKEKWQQVEELNLESGLSEVQAQRYAIARYAVKDFDEFKSLYQLKSDPELLQPPATVQWIDRFAGFLTDPRIAMLLLLVGMFALSSEMSSPGIGVPGFIAAICFTLFFWSQYCGGNADWLEIMMFGLGAAFIALELFVLPGFGLFGFSGILLMVASIILASQTFVFPHNESEMRQVPYSLGLVVCAILGAILPMAIIPRYVDRIPWLRAMALNPKTDPSLKERLAKESVADYSYLLGKVGEVTAPLSPAGKARFGEKIVHVTSTGRFVEKGSSVKVIDAKGTRVIVEQVKEV